jgi:branched-chain amino acid transport system ATP-binding protein
MALLELRDVERYGQVRAEGISLAVDQGSSPCSVPTAPARRRSARSGRSSGAARSSSTASRSAAAGGRSRSSASRTSPRRGTFAELSVEENLRLGAYVRKGSIDNDVARVSSTSRGSRARLGQHAGTLSGGEQQMLALARADEIAMLLLDEPSLGLAP